MTIYDLLIGENVPSNLIAGSINALSKHKYKILLKPNLRYEVIKNDDGIMTSLLIELSRSKHLVLEYMPEKIECSMESIPTNIEYSVLSAEIENSLFETLSSHGFSDSLAYELNSIFMWDIDFNTDIRAGDRFVIIFEKIPVSTGISSSRNILGARFNLHGKIFDAIGFFNDKNYFDYYDLAGNNLKKQFLTSPLKFAHVSSRFSYRRFHPILKLFRPHLGVDYSASSGTPVLSTSNGKIIFKGWDKGGGGNTLKVRHPNGFVTAYMHLRKFAGGSVINKEIRQGQVIGYVGATGLATGPHLDYRIQQNGKYINPLNLINPSSGKLSHSLQKYYKIHRDRLMKHLEKHTNTDYYDYYND
jgi:murein DD-endopeptidase MepM/ murein hydrolase activator NlpD